MRSKRSANLHGRYGYLEKAFDGEPLRELDSGGRDGFRVGGGFSERRRRTDASPLIVPLRG
jgi:hypothetical protein